MQIVLEKVSKKFNSSWIFKNVNYTFEEQGNYAILGSNGSGKSTLLQILSGYLSPSRGKVNYLKGNTKVSVDAIYKYISLATPYMELPEEFTLSEVIDFHSKFKEPLLDAQAFMERIELAQEKNKEIKNFSSGMRQRLKLGLCLLFNSEIILLDEPTTHLDVKAIAWYRALVTEYSQNRCLIISSNQLHEYDFCNNQLQIGDFKK